MRPCLPAMLLTVALALQLPAGSVQLLTSIRTGDAPSTEQLLSSGVDVNTRDESGATALMYAAAFGSEPAMRLLLNSGASVNAPDHSGATALMWATHDATKVRVLLDRQADVNAVRADGTTPLLSAALRGATDVMRMLIAAGATAGTSAVPTPWKSTLPQIALTTNDPAMREFLNGSERCSRTSMNGRRRL